MADAVGRGGTPPISVESPALRPPPATMHDGSHHATTAQPLQLTPATDDRRTLVGALVVAAAFPVAVFALTRPELAAAAVAGYVVARLAAALGESDAEVDLGPTARPATR